MLWSLLHVLNPKCVSHPYKCTILRWPKLCCTQTLCNNSVKDQKMCLTVQRRMQAMIEGLGILLTRMTAPPPAPPMMEMPPGAMPQPGGCMP
jgi:hypothetical protein